jgi:cytochrome c
MRPTMPIAPGRAWRVLSVEKAGMVLGFSYSNAMKKSGIVWDTKILDAYLESPQQVVPGNRMPYAGLKNPTDRTDLVAYLATLK